MFRARVVVPVAVFAISAMTAVLPSITSAAGDSVPVNIHDGGDVSTWGYGPTSTTITVGQTVTFTNTGTSPHDATSTDGSWKTPLLTSGASATVTFSAPGTFNYTCVLHPWMKGTLVVAPAISAPAPAPAPAAPDVSQPNNTTVSAPAPAPAAPDVAPAANPQPQTDATSDQPADDTGSVTGSGSAN